MIIMDKINLEQLETFGNSAIHFGIKLLIAIGILIIGFWVVKRIMKSMRKMMEEKHIDPSLKTFLTSTMNILLKILVLVIVFTTVGIEMTSIVAILGAASLAIGMALSGTLQNFAGGVVILTIKPFEIGDLIETDNGHLGFVKGIMIFTTRIRTFDNRIIYLPNGSLVNGALTNHTKEGRRRIDAVFGVSYGDDVAKARNLLIEMLENDKRVHKSPAPAVYLNSLSDSSVDIIVKFWTDFDTYYDLQYELTEKVYNEFPKNGLNFPFPQMDVHFDKIG
ncbi:mechanosensitive ion channel family protein [Dysgonomonas sp. 521]|nr:mechanosensitive ion channel family protein [Dysgonomonas sp. 521]